MESQLSSNEASVAKDIIETGFKDAAKALSFFTKCEVEVSFVCFNNYSTELLSSLSENPNELYYQLKSDLNGDLNGCCYLWFAEKHVNEIMRAFYKNKVLDEQAFQKKSNNLVLEIDNIVTAAVTSHFANTFDCRTFAGVPLLKRYNKDEVIKDLEKNSNSNSLILNFETKFNSEQIDVKAEFAWFMDQTFIQQIKKYNLKKI